MTYLKKYDNINKKERNGTIKLMEKTYEVGNMEMKDLLKTNCFDVQQTMIIIGSCLKSMQPEA